MIRRSRGKRIARALATAIAAVALVAALGVGISACGSDSSSSSDSAGYSFTGSGHPNVDQASTRYSGGPIDSSTVGDLEVAWTLPITSPPSAFGSYASSPIVSKGVIYSQDLSSNVQAIEQETGKVLWSATYEMPDHGPNGVVVAEGRVYGATPTFAFALDQKTGEEVWRTKLIRNNLEGIDIAPGYDDGLVYVSTVPVNVEEFYGGNGVGIIWALDAKTGKKVWKFNTVPKSLWGNPKVNSGGGLWYTPSFDGKGSMYVGIGNPGPVPGTEQFPWGSSRPGPNLYTNSVAKLDAKTGKLDWHYQLTPHDVNDWDLQNPPILVEPEGKEMVIGSGKSGIVLGLDRKTGARLWEQPVGIHNGKDDIGYEAMVGNEPNKFPLKIYPGALGGVIAPMAVDKTGSTVFVPVVNSPLTLLGPTEKTEEGPSTGEIVALDTASGEVKWKKQLATPAFGATTAVNDLVFVTTYEGTISAFEMKSGDVVWRQKLPAGTNVGVTVVDDMLIAPAGVAAAEGQEPQIVAYRLGG